MTTYPRKVLVLGASGFIGRAVLKHFLDLGCLVMALEHRVPLGIEHERLIRVQGSLGELDLKRLPVSPELVVHAARNRSSLFGKWGRAFVASRGRKENQRLLLQLKSMERPPVVVYCSGSLMYGSGDEPFTELSPLRPSSFARQYVEAELPFLEAMEERSYPVIMLRLPWVIGNGSWFRWNYMDLMQKGYVPLYGSGERRMSFVDVAVIPSLILEAYAQQHRGLLNIAHPQVLTQQEWACLLSLVSGLPVRPVDTRSGRIDKAVLEAFETEAVLESIHEELQTRLRPLHGEDLEQVVRKYLQAVKLSEPGVASASLQDK